MTLTDIPAALLSLLERSGVAAVELGGRAVRGQNWETVGRRAARAGERSPPQEQQIFLPEGAEQPSPGAGEGEVAWPSGIGGGLGNQRYFT